MSNQYYFFGTRTTFIQAAPKIFFRVNGALACHFCTTCLATCKLYSPTLVFFFGFSSSVLILGFVEFIGL